MLTVFAVHILFKAIYNFDLLMFYDLRIKINMEGDARYFLFSVVRAYILCLNQNYCLKRHSNSKNYYIVIYTVKLNSDLPFPLLY